MSASLQQAHQELYAALNDMLAGNDRSDFDRLV